MTKDDYVTKCKRLYPYLDLWDLEETYEIAKRELFITIYSTNIDIVTEDTEIPYIYEYAVLEAMKEIINMGNMRNYTSYSENGWSWTRPDTGLAAYQNIKSKAGAY